MNAEHYDPRKLVEARKAKFTQKELADKLNVKEITIYRAETGKITSYELLLEICKAVELDIREILIADKIFSSVA
jgi:DNA-binding XRE family transcriptional regulator